MSTLDIKNNLTGEISLREATNAAIGNSEGKAFSPFYASGEIMKEVFQVLQKEADMSLEEIKASVMNDLVETYGSDITSRIIGYCSAYDEMFNEWQIMLNSGMSVEFFTSHSEYPLIRGADVEGLSKDLIDQINSDGSKENYEGNNELGEMWNNW